MIKNRTLYIISWIVHVIAIAFEIIQFPFRLILRTVAPVVAPVVAPAVAPCYASIWTTCM